MIYSLGVFEEEIVKKSLRHPPLAAVDPTNPQSWNRYAYVANSPLSNIDPTGLACYPLERAIWGSCAPFMGNGVNFGAGWNEFDVMNIPVTTGDGGSWQYVRTTGPSSTMQFTGMPGLPDGDYSVTSSILMAVWVPGTVIGNGFDLFGDQVGMDIWHASPQCSKCGSYFTNATAGVNVATAYTLVGTAGAFAAGEIATTSAGDYLFARGTGLLNSNDFLRVGWGWYGGNLIDYLPVGAEVFRIVVGNPNSPIHWHLWSW